MTLLWGLWVLMFIALEAYAVFDNHPNDTLTQTVLHTVPGPLVLLFVSWLALHFGRRVLKGRRDGL